MNPARRALLLFHTARHLKPVQIWARLRRRFLRPRPSMEPPPSRRRLPGGWIEPAPKRPVIVGADRLRLLNEERDVPSPASWVDRGVPKLWRYNLHYHDWLLAPATGLEAVRDRLFTRWLAENPPCAGDGWEPYPISLRMVNWIKWALAGRPLGRDALSSLAVQARLLSADVEWHLLGNHLLANAKALIFAGVFFEGREAERWLAQGLSILEREIPEQILPDGGHFELSPMYHSIILEDLLDLLNLGKASDALPLCWRSALEEKIQGMRRWLTIMTHPDGEIALFNDAAFGIAPSPAELEAYAHRLGLGAATNTQETNGDVAANFLFPGQDSAPSQNEFHEMTLGGGVASRKSGPHAAIPVDARDGLDADSAKLTPPRLTLLSDSGYVRVASGRATAFLDVARVGPDYLPGHAHADTLTFELSLDGQRLIVDAGTSEYGAGPERLRQRGTRAHNCVVLDGADSSEVWGGFRVARRARPFDLRSRAEGNVLAVSCAHDGYRRLPGRAILRREWLLDAHSLTVADHVEGDFASAEASFLFHPEVAVKSDPGSSTSGQGRLRDGTMFAWRLEGADGRLEPRTWSPQFGMTLPCLCLVATFSSDSAKLVLVWQ